MFPRITTQFDYFWIDIERSFSIGSELYVKIIFIIFPRTAHLDRYYFDLLVYIEM